MRTTIIVHDRLGEAARARARREGMSLSALVARALEEHLARPPAHSDAPPFRLVTVGGGPRSGIDLDRISALIIAEDEEAHAGKDR